MSPQPQLINLFLNFSFVTSGDVLGFENLVYTVFEFVHCLIESNRYRATVKKTVDQIIYFVILYMQITEDQVSTVYQFFSLSPNFRV